MALGADYITRAVLKAYMNLEVDIYDAQVDSVISSASRAVELHTLRQFNTDNAATARRFKPVRCGLALVQDFQSLTGLVVKTDDDGDGVFEHTWTVGTDYEVEPYGGLSPAGVPGWPYYKIVAVGSYGFSGGERSRIEVTANWGWATVPSPVIEAVKVLASDAFQYKDTRMGVAGMDQFGTVLRVKDNTVAATMLRPYRRGKVMVR